MPTISMFFGLIIRMYYAPKEHNPPHIHVEHQGTDTIFNILDGSVIDGEMSARHTRFVQAWIEIHREELLADWSLCQSGDHPFVIDPLK